MGRVVCVGPLYDGHMGQDDAHWHAHLSRTRGNISHPHTYQVVVGTAEGYRKGRRGKSRLKDKDETRSTGGRGVKGVDEEATPHMATSHVCDNLVTTSPSQFTVLHSLRYKRRRLTFLSWMEETVCRIVGTDYVHIASYL